MIVAGIDLSLTSTGVCVAHAPERLELQRVQSRPPKTGTETLVSRHLRAQEIVDQIVRVVAPADVVGIESPAYAMKTGKTHDRSGLWWMLVSSLLTSGKRVIEVSPSTRCQYATGKGNAPKDTVLADAIKTYRQADITGNDVADAVIIAAIVARLTATPLEVSTPSQLKMKALAKVVVPALDLVAA